MTARWGILGGIFDPMRTDDHAEVLRRDVFELVRLVEYGVRAVGNYFAEGAIAQRCVREQEMVIHDHHVRFRGAFTHPGDEALAIARAFRSQTV